MRNFLRLLLACFATFICQFVFSQISLPLNTIVTENFNSIGTSATATLPASWKMSSAGTGTTSGYGTGTNVTTTTIAANSGLPATGGRYNWATTANTDRAIGFLTSATYATPNAILVNYRNTTGASVNSVTIAFAVERYVVNAGTFSLSFASSTDGTSWTSQTGGDIAAGLFATGANATTFTSPQTITKTVTINVTVPNNGDIFFRWIFNTSNTNSQGLGLDDVSVFAGTATPVLTAKLKDILQVDNGTPFQFNEGDQIRYQTTIKNIGTGDANNIQLSEPVPSNTTLVTGYKTSALARDDNYTSSFNTAFAGTTVLANDFGVPLPAVVQTFGPVSNAAATAAGSTGTTSAGGTLNVATNGTFSYTPPTGFSGIDQFKYVTGNGNLPNNDALVSITVSGDITITANTIDPSCNNGTNGCVTVNATGGNPPFLYSIDGGAYQASNIFCGLPAGVHNIAVKDAGGYIKTGTATLNNPAAIVVSGTIPNLIYNTAMSTATFSKTGGTGTIVWTATGLPTGVTINSSTGDVTGTPTQTGSFNAVITATDANNCTGTKNVSFTVAPKLVNDAYNVVGNTQLVADAHSAPTTPFTASATNIITNDVSDVTPTVTAVTNAATANGGTITIAANGKFTYSPPVAVIASDSYIYTATANGVSATATINFTIANKIWYVNNTYAGANGAANGTSARPYTDVATAEAASLANDYIYVHTGTGNTTGNALLKSGQILRGAGSLLSVGALSIAAGTKPTLTGMITLANNVQVDGFDMSTGSITAITSSGATTVNVSVGNVTTSGAPNGVTLTNTTGTITIAGGSQTNSTGTAFNVSGGTANISYGGVISQATSSQRAINIASATAGTIAFNGAVSSTGSSTGINLSSNTGATINFTGAITLNTGANAAFTATGGGTVSATATSNTITTTTGTALNVTGTTIGTSGITLVSINKNGGNTATSAIVLNNTGAGTLTITGNGTTAASGGTIQNIQGADAISLNTTGGLVTLKNMVIQDITASTDASDANDHRSNVDAIQGQTVNGGLTLNNVTIQRISDDGINGSVDGASPIATVWNGLTITNCTIQSTNRFNVANHADATDEGAVYISGIKGIVSVTGSTFQNASSGLFLMTDVSGSLDMTVQSNNFLTLYKEIGTLSSGLFGINVLQLGSLTSIVRIGDQNDASPALGNTFINGGDRAAIRVIGENTSSGNLKTEISRNSFTVTDHSSPGQPAGNLVYNFPQSGVLLRARGTGNFEGNFTTNTFSQCMHADGGLGNLSIIAEGGVSEFIVKNNAFILPWDAPVELRADGNSGTQTSAATLFQNNTYGDGTVGDGTTDLGGPSPYEGFFAATRNGGKLDLTMQNETLGNNDPSSALNNSFYTQTTAHANVFNLFLQNILSPRGFRLSQNAPTTFNLYRNGSGAADAQGVLQANGNRGGSGVDNTNPPAVTTTGTITLSNTAPTLPVIVIN